ncbi:3-hydroxyisobutyrate dehydrogenase [Microbacteriaceae bacterium SG_E_30_P1]|uniref:3-hydroxyisobutyrate dehydrogenase n=1 Tax=Antiquaquibacter oligotrophicus TaxID=2880260 RepID=A0ABT6KNB7_9MICO|nr:NAD(P)-dependent oxidoreductase [Antiquaquibacter oligotrophicus]MDH6181507.1 3-hydroxyisobutyrate dehydrogenase [Antiquaquibacter oligotrophicus]UDF12803.1 NAD(P)-dependent oxidoreductase [Antiquaquibacter oligotrophicus]
MTRQLTHDVGFLGLGIMGAPMAANLAAAGPLLVWNRTRGAAEELATKGAEIAGSPSEVAERASVIFVMLRDESATNAVLPFDGSVDYRDRTIVQMGTMTPEYSARLAERVTSAGGRYVEAPVSGSRRPAVAGQLVAMVAGDDADIERVRPHLEAMCSSIFVCGAPPNALTMKLAVNTFLITMVTGLAESFHFAETAGLDLGVLERILDAGPMASPVSRSKAHKIVDVEWSPDAAIRDVLKNSRFVVDEAHRNGSAAPLMEASARLYEETNGLGFSEDDMAAVIRALRARVAE